MTLLLTMTDSPLETSLQQSQELGVFGAI